jgi:outer membrane lipoprotein-sorting protein
MKKSKIFPALAQAIMLVTACLCIGWGDTWEDVKTAAGKVSSITAEFTQEKHLKILSRPLVSQGFFCFQAPDSLRWEYQHPIQSVLLMHNGKTKRYIRRDGNTSEDAGANLQSMQVVLQEITQWLNGRFDENPAFSTLLEPGRRIVLSPREKSLAMMIQRIELVLSDRPGIIKSVIIYEGEQSFTKLEFNNVKLNQPLEDSLFRTM